MLRTSQHQENCYSGPPLNTTIRFDREGSLRLASSLRLQDELDAFDHLIECRGLSREMLAALGGK